MWLAIAAVEVVLTLLSQLPQDVRRPVLNVTGGLIASAALLAVIAVGWVLVLRHLTGAPRVAAAVPVVLLAAAARGGVLQWLLVAWGMSPPGAAGYRYRIVTSTFVVVLGAVVGVAVKIGVDGHRARLETLTAEQARLALVLERAEADVRTDQTGAVATIGADLAEQLTHVAEASPLLAISSLEQIAADVVRPLSHDLAATVPTWQPPEPEEQAQRLDWARVWAAMASPGTIDPFGPAILTFLVFPVSALVMGVGVALVLHVVVFGLLFLGLWALRRLAPRVAADRPTLVRLAVTMVLLVVACVPAAIGAALLPGTGTNLINSLYLVVLVPLVALLFSFIRARESSGVSWTRP